MEKEIFIDFNYAHDQWMKNKIKKPNGMCEYRCGVMMKNGKECRKSVKVCKSSFHISKRSNKYEY